MMYSLPKVITVDGNKHPIRNECDYRIILDVLEALDDEELAEEDRLYCALYILIGNAVNDIEDVVSAVEQMLTIINVGKPKTSGSKQPKLMDWQHDFGEIAPAISKYLGYDVRDEARWTHWWTFVGGYKEVGDCSFSAIVAIRKKRIKGKKLEDWEREFCQNHPDLINLPSRLSSSDREWLEELEEGE